MKPLDTDSLQFICREKPEDPLLDNVTLVHVFGKTDDPCCANSSL